MNELKAEHSLNRILGKSGDFVPLLLFYEVVLNHKRAAASNYLVEFEVFKKIVGADSAGRHKGYLTVGRRHSLKHLKTACSFCGEEFYCSETKLESRLDVGGI